MRLRFVLPLACLALLALPAAPGRTAVPPLAWRAWDRGLDEAKSSGRHVLVDVYTDWCGWCRRMEADVYTRPEIRDYLARKFVLVKLNAEATDAARYQGKLFTSQALAARFEVSDYPTTIFLKSGGDHLISVPGYVPADRFLLVLRYIGDGYLDRGETFEAFLKANGADAPH
ncbi:MAG: thioredoxin family protein [Candidatus Eisenbacteria bacterium]|uniref:Thioredoxin family protein n=1 Tax=Eiseniibacteriota bacterium TaxID=2212470 RepID=A0A9D6L412_UNCEI|nr:thioredoxin family protein [Candidatus Eisenbacteria bacterium]MBI3539397.1 thioredoxin family protein [Candidatus Eisenbacteria bacterium]